MRCEHFRENKTKCVRKAKSKGKAIISLSENIEYEIFEKYSDYLAYHMHERLQNDKSSVVVYGQKSSLMIICFITCVKSGRAYCPISDLLTVPNFIYSQF